MALAPESSRGVGLLARQDFILGTGGAPWFSASLLGLLRLDEGVAFLHLWGEDWVLTAVQRTDPYWSPGGGRWMVFRLTTTLCFWGPLTPTQPMTTQPGVAAMIA